MPAKTTIKLSWLVLPDEICRVWYLLHKTTGAFCVWVKALSNDYSTEKIYNRNILVHSPFNQVFSLILSIIVLSTYLMADSFLVKNRRRLHIIRFDTPDIEWFLQKK